MKFFVTGKNKRTLLRDTAILFAQEVDDGVFIHFCDGSEAKFNVDFNEICRQLDATDDGEEVPQKYEYKR